MIAPEPFELASEALGPLPVVNHFLDRIGLTDRLERHLPNDDRVGRTLDRLFDADRASLITDVVPVEEPPGHPSSPTSATL